MGDIVSTYKWYLVEKPNGTLSLIVKQAIMIWPYLWTFIYSFYHFESYQSTEQMRHVFHLLSINISNTTLTSLLVFQHLMALSL